MSKKKHWFIIMLLPLGVLFFAGFYVVPLMVHQFQYPMGSHSGPDARRISDIRQIQYGLDLYHKANARYPRDLNNLVGITGITHIPKDPQANWCFMFWCGGNKAYDYAPSGDEQHYVLRAMFEDPGNPALKESPKGIVNGLDCAPPAYCVAL